MENNIPEFVKEALIKAEEFDKQFPENRSYQMKLEEQQQIRQECRINGLEISEPFKKQVDSIDNVEDVQNIQIHLFMKAVLNVGMMKELYVIALNRNVSLIKNDIPELVKNVFNKAKEIDKRCTEIHKMDIGEDEKRKLAIHECNDADFRLLEEKYKEYVDGINSFNEAQNIQFFAWAELENEPDLYHYAGKGLAGYAWKRSVELMPDDKSKTKNNNTITEKDFLKQIETLYIEAYKVCNPLILEENMRRCKVDSEAYLVRESLKWDSKQIDAAVDEASAPFVSQLEGLLSKIDDKALLDKTVSFFQTLMDAHSWTHYHFVGNFLGVAKDRAEQVAGKNNLDFERKQ